MGAIADFPYENTKPYRDSVTELDCLFFRTLSNIQQDKNFSRIIELMDVTDWYNAQREHTFYYQGKTAIDGRNIKIRIMVDIEED